MGTDTAWSSSPRTSGSDDPEVDLALAAAVRGSGSGPAGLPVERVVSRALYHGLAGSLVDRLDGWPSGLVGPLRRAAFGQAMWEMRHRVLVADLLGGLQAAGVRALVLKGTALAYDLYDVPATRTRGDTDLLIAPADLDAARAVLAAQGFAHAYGDPSAEETVRLQEAWRRRTPDGLVHEIDLHWQALNAPTLATILPFEAAWARSRPLPRLAPAARGLPLDMALLLACAHRAQHIVNPYIVDGRVHYGGDRLIWLRDIDLLARALGAEEWESLVTLARQAGLGPVVLDGLSLASDRLGTPLPQGLPARLADESGAAASLYLLGSGPVGRAWRDLRAVPDLPGKATFLARRAFPSAPFMRMKYPADAHRPLLLLHLRRIGEFLGWRSRRGRT